MKRQESQIEARDNEILRLGDLYVGGQNLEKLNMKYQQETNEKVTKKLSNQVDFLNKENHRMRTELDIYQGDKSVADHLDQYRKELDETNFENQTLRKDLRELTGTLKDFQQAEFRLKQLDRLRLEEEAARQEEMNQKQVEYERQADEV